MRQTHEQQADSSTKFEREARARPRRHQPVPSQYRTWWGHGPEARGKGGCGLVAGRGEKIYSRLLLKSLLGGTSCWDDRSPKRGNLRRNRWVHVLRMRREGINIVAGKGYDTQRDKTSSPLSGKGGCRIVWSASIPRPDKGD